MRVTRLTSITVLLALIGTACSTSQKASPDDKLVIYSGRSEKLVGAILTDFSTETGIEIEVKYGETAELAATILEEGDKSPADIFFAQDGGALGAVEDAELFRTLPAEILDKVPTRFRSDTGGWVGTTGRLRVIGYRPDVTPVDTIPDRVIELTDPRWKGKVAWAPTNGSFQLFITAMRKTLGEDETKAWLEAMKANDTQSYPKNDAIAEAVNDDEIQVGLLNHYYPLELAEEVPGAKIAVKFLPGDVGGLANAAGVGILKGSNEPQAQRFVEYLLQASTQRAFVERTFEYPLIEGVDGPASLPSLAELNPPDIDLNDLSDLQGTLDLLAEVGLL